MEEQNTRATRVVAPLQVVPPPVWEGGERGGGTGGGIGQPRRAARGRCRRRRPWRWEDEGGAPLASLQAVPPLGARCRRGRGGERGGGAGGGGGGDWPWHAARGRCRRHRIGPGIGRTREEAEEEEGTREFFSKEKQKLRYILLVRILTRS